MKVALMGGSFDPPHLAHMQILKHLLKTGSFDQVWVVPSRQNPLKNNTTAFVDRLQMCRLAFGNLDPRIQILSDEENLSGYTIDLVRYLRRHYPKVRFTFVAGSDLQNELSSWKENEQLQREIQFQFFPRSPNPSPFLPISSTEIRDCMKKDLPIDALVPKSVEEYIQKHRLYV